MYGVQITGYDDIFVVKYTCSVQSSLPLHVDAGDISFIIALSEPLIDYSGGGTSQPISSLQTKSQLIVLQVPVTVQTVLTIV